MNKKQIEARNRAEYMLAFEAVNKAAQMHLQMSTDDNWGLDGIRRVARDVISELRDRDRYSDTANQLARMVNTGLMADGYRTKANSVKADLLNVQEYLFQIPEAQRPAALIEATKQIVSGKSIAQAFGKAAAKAGTKVEKPKEFTAADAYVAHAVRQGPQIKDLITPKDQEQALLGKMGLRGLQWGNSVTDSEREHHLKMSAEAFTDLADVLGLPPKMVSFNDRLGLAVGARGHGTAMAHYEPKMRVINLTRKNGVGSLAHEWGHFFDNICSELVQDKKAEYLTDAAARPDWERRGEENPSDQHPVSQAMRSLFDSEPMKAFRQRLDHEMSTKYAEQISFKKREYWRSTIEVWARCFERHVQTKLRGAGRENTYLSGGMNQDLWPNDEESKALAPHFDKVFEAFKASGLVNKALRALWRKAS